MKKSLLFLILTSCATMPAKYENERQKILDLMIHYDSLLSVETCRKIIDIRIDKYPNYTELTEVHNEVLFNHLLSQPNEFVVHLEKKQDQQPMIYRVLNSPIHDLIDFDIILTKLKDIQRTGKLNPNQKLVANNIISIISSIHIN